MSRVINIPTAFLFPFSYLLLSDFRGTTFLYVSLDFHALPCLSMNRNPFLLYFLLHEKKARKRQFGRLLTENGYCALCLCHQLMCVFPFLFFPPKKEVEKIDQFFPQPEIEESFHGVFPVYQQVLKLEQLTVDNIRNRKYLALELVLTGNGLGLGLV